MFFISLCYTEHMFIQVRLLKGYPQPLLYEVPHAFQEKIQVGSIVQVPIQKRSEQALVVKQFQNKPSTSFEVRAIEGCQQLPDDQHYIQFIKQLATYYQCSQLHFIKRIHQFINQKSLHTSTTYSDDTSTYNNIELTQEQQLIVDAITQQIDDQQFNANLLHGVTGSGKTEVYKKLLLHTYQQNKTSLLLLPEVTLALQFEQLLRITMPRELHIGSFHSASIPKEKKIIWQRLLDGKPTIIIGVHLPVLLPLPHLGLIIVDEEHETGYQEKKHPKTNTKEVALLRAKLHNIPILLGSATPSVSSLYNVTKRGWHFFELKKRFAGTFPNVQLVALNQNKQRPNFWISKELTQEINKRLTCGQQTILFLNRRGHSFFVQCKQCSFIMMCNNCSVSLTLHDNNQLMCHYCGFTRTLPSACTQCKAPEKELLKKGIGTQQLMTIVQKMFPNARIARADMDTSSKKRQWQETVTKFHNRELDILIGTQTITKGYDFAGVTLVGIIWADLNLHFPRYNATETTLQQLIQVAGRAGRKTNDSLVIVQTIADHQAFNYLKETDYTKFYEQEITTRAEVGYPPCMRLVEIELKHSNENTVQTEAQQLAQSLRAYIEQKYNDVILLGPATPPIAKIKNAYTRIIFLKHADIGVLCNLFKKIDQNSYKSKMYFTPNPQ